MSEIRHQWSVLYLNFFNRFKSVIHHCDCACWFARYLDTDLLRHGSVCVETRSGCSASVILDNTLLYPPVLAIVPGTERDVLIIWIISLQNNIFIFNVLSAFLHPQPLTTHTTKPHTPKPDIPATICHIVIIFIISLWYRTIFPTDPHCFGSWRNYSSKQDFP